MIGKLLRNILDKLLIILFIASAAVILYLVYMAITNLFEKGDMISNMIAVYIIFLFTMLVGYMLTNTKYLFASDAPIWGNKITIIVQLLSFVVGSSISLKE